MSSEWKIYHNPRCTKSRQALELLKENKIEATVIEYLKEKIDVKSLKQIIKNSNKPAKDFLRTKEKEFSDYKNENLETAESVAKIISKCPKLLERPVVVKGNKSVIARPPELLKSLL